MSSSATPRLVGPYKPLRKLGEGGMGVVYCAQDTRSPDRLVALKLVSASSSGGGDDSARRFLREWKILESLRHPSIVSLYEVGIHQGQSWFAMELLTGQPLSAWTGRPWPSLLPLFIQVCEGMDYLAARAVVHRDLSPDNVFVVHEQGSLRAKILDFGIAKDTTAQETIHNFTRTGLLMGKPPYWSPEQIGTLRKGEALDWRSDLYTLGVIFHRLLAGRLPFEADTPIGYISLHISEPPAELAAPEGNPPIPPAVAAVVGKMLAKRREDRPQSYGEVIEVFRSALAEAGVPAPPPTSTLAGDVPTAATVVPRTRDTVAWDGGTTPTTPTAATAPLAAGVTHPVVTRRTSALAGVEENEPTVALSAAGRAAVPAEVAAAPPTRTRGRAPLLGALAGAAAVAAVGLWLLPRSGERPDAAATLPAPAPVAPALGAPAGTLALSSLPWGRVQSVVDDATGQPFPLPRGLTTPVRIELPPGRYRVELASGVGPETRRLVVEVRAGQTRVETVAFSPGSDALRLLE